MQDNMTLNTNSYLIAAWQRPKMERATKITVNCMIDLAEDGEPKGERMEVTKRALYSKPRDTDHNLVTRLFHGRHCERKLLNNMQYYLWLECVLSYISFANLRHMIQKI